MVIENNGYYYHAAYADDDEGTGFSLTEYDDAVYVGNYTDTSATESTDYTDYEWQVIGEDIVDEDDIVDDEDLEDVDVSELSDQVDEIEDTTETLNAGIIENDENLQATQGTSDEGIGNPNELVGTNQGTTGWTASSGITLSSVTGTIYDETEDAVNYVVATCNTAGNNYIYFDCTELRAKLAEQTEDNSFTFSADVNMSTLFEIATVAVQDTDGTNIQLSFNAIDNEPNEGMEDYDNSGTWIYNRSTADAEDTVTESAQVLYFDLSAMTAGETLAIANLKIEGGALATPWRASLDEVETIANTALSTANNAINLADGVNQHFWYDSAGAHVTEVTQDEYIDDPTTAGGNTIITSEGIGIRNGTTQLAAFTDSGAQIGRNGEANTTITSNGITFKSKGGAVAGRILSNAAASGTVVNDNFANPLHKGTFSLALSQAATAGTTTPCNVYIYTVNGGSLNQIGVCDYAENGGIQSLDVAYNAVVPRTTNVVAYVTLTNTGYLNVEMLSPYAQTEVIVEVYYYASVEIPTVSFGQETTAESGNQFAIGKYNVADSADAYAFIIGNGTADNARSDALTVDWNGDVRLALNTSASSGTDHDIYAALVSLGWDTDCIG